MVNKLLSIRASYKNQFHIFNCIQTDFLNQATKKFQIDDVKNIELYSTEKNGQNKRIVQSDIIDMMKIRIEDKKTRNGQQRTIDSYTQSKGVDSIITKLKNNSPLTGQERKEMIFMLENYTPIVSNKRKNSDVTPECKHKKVQVNMPLTNSKESTTQTDKITQPFSSQEGAIVDEDVSEKLRRMYSKPDVNREEVARLMAVTHDQRRFYINLRSPPVSNVKEKYPFLFELDEVKRELGRIFYSEKPKEFINNMYKYAPFIVQHCASDELSSRTKKSMDRCHSNVQKNYAQAVGSVFILTHLMKENWGFVHLQDYPSGSQDIYPHIDASNVTFKELFFDGSLYDIYVEDVKLCDASDFLEAIMCLVAAFFIFNIDYPLSCRKTMIIFEKLYLNANDTKDLDDETLQVVKLLEYEAQNEHKRKRN